MDLTKLFEAIDEKVLTTTLKRSLEAQFNEAVEAKAQTLAEELSTEKITEAIESMTSRVELIESKKAESLAEAIEVLTAKFAEKETVMVESIDTMLEKAIDDFVNETKSTLQESIKSEKAELIIDSLSAMIIAAGIDVATIVEGKEAIDNKSELAESIAKYDRLMIESLKKDKEIDDLIRMGVVSEMKEGMSMLEVEKFEKLAEQIEFSKDANFVEKLNIIKESVIGKSTKVEVIGESYKPKESKIASIDARFI